MTSWATYDLGTLLKTGFPADVREKALHAASLDYPSDTNLQSGMMRYNRSTNRFEQHNGTTWGALTFGTDAIPNLPASRITSGAFDVARVPSLPASQITSGTFNAARIPSLPASQINSGTFATARIPSLPASQITSGQFAAARIPNLDASIITTGAFGAARIPSLPASQINSGTFATARIPSLPASQITSGQFSTDRIPNLPTSKITTGTLDQNRLPIISDAIHGTRGGGTQHAVATTSVSGFMGSGDKSKLDLLPITRAVRNTSAFSTGSYSLVDIPGLSSNLDPGTYFIEIYLKIVNADTGGFALEMNGTFNKSEISFVGVGHLSSSTPHIQNSQGDLLIGWANSVISLDPCFVHITGTLISAGTASIQLRIRLNSGTGTISIPLDSAIMKTTRISN